VVTTDGLEAAERLKTGPSDFDAIVADVQMPGLDGIGLAEQVLATHPTMRFVLMSGLAGALVPAQRLKSAKFRLLSKPFTLEQIRAEVRAVLA
jgi:two-component system cell cycle sensor histidine kinase/response regulator CckA